MDFIAIKKHDSTIKYILLFFLSPLTYSIKYTKNLFLSFPLFILPLSTFFLFLILQFPFLYVRKYTSFKFKLWKIQDVTDFHSRIDHFTYTPERFKQIFDFKSFSLSPLQQCTLNLSKKSNIFGLYTLSLPNQPINLKYPRQGFKRKIQNHTFFNLTRRSRSKNRQSKLITIFLRSSIILSRNQFPFSQQSVEQRNSRSLGQHFRLKKFENWSSDRSILGNRDAIRIHSSRYGES